MRRRGVGVEGLRSNPKGLHEKGSEGHKGTILYVSEIVRSIRNDGESKI